MAHGSAAAAPGARQNGQADLERRLPPPPVGKGRPARGDGVGELAQLGLAPMAGVAGDLLAPVFAIDEQPVRRLADDARLAGDDIEPEEGLAPRLAALRPARLALLRPRDLAVGVDRAGEARRSRKGASAGLRQAPFADVPGELGDIEIAVAVEGQRRRGAFLEFQQCAEVPFGVEMPIGPPGHAADAPNPSAADEADDVDHVGSLAVDQPPTLAGHKLRCEPRALQPVIEVEGVDLDQPPEPAARYHLADRLDRRLIDLGMTLQELDAVRLRGRDHAVAFPQRHGHRLFADDMLAVPGGADRVLRVFGVRRCDPNRVDVMAPA